MKTFLRRCIACLLIVTVPAQAGLVSTASVAAAGDRERVSQFLELADVQQQMEALGVAPQDVKSRVAALSDAEVAGLAGQLDSLPAGGNGVGILGLLVLVFLVLLLTDILGLTKVFPFTRSVR